jgi:GNAT superfamily N-acetyltransferase
MLTPLPSTVLTSMGQVRIEHSAGATCGDRARRLRDSLLETEQRRVRATPDSGPLGTHDLHATYFVATVGPELVGTIKVVSDSMEGLPCEGAIDLTDLRRLGSLGSLVELGNFAVLPSFRSAGVGVLLMRHAVRHAALQLGATHALADFFIDDSPSRSMFFRALGFVPVGPPYRDHRFVGSPTSQISVLDLFLALARSARPPIRPNETTRTLPCRTT